MDDKKNKKAETSEEKEKKLELERQKRKEYWRKKKFEQVVKEGGIIWGVC